MPKTNIKTKTKKPAPEVEIISPNVGPDVEKRLAEIAAAIQRGADGEQFQAELDALLGTGMEDRDPAAEAVWENSYRNQGREE